MPHHLLIIDDDESGREALAKLLRRRGCEVTTVATFDEGLACIRTRDYALALVDLSLEASDALQTIARCCAELDLPWVAVTATNDEEVVRRVSRAHAGYQHKPIRDMEGFYQRIMLRIAGVEEGHNAAREVIRSTQAQGDMIPADRLPPISEKTKVELSFAQMGWLVGAVTAACAVVLTQTNSINNKAEKLDYRLTTIEASLKKSDDTATARDRDSRSVDTWRVTITSDVINLGRATNTPVNTKGSP